MRLLASSAAFALIMCSYQMAYAGDRRNSSGSTVSHQGDQENRPRSNSCFSSRTASPFKVYIASPLGFSEAGRIFYDKKLIPLLRNFGCEIFDPWSLTPQAKIDAVLKMPYGQQRKSAWKKLDSEIARNNTSALSRADIVFAILDGTDVDSGTAAEIGCAFGLGKLIIGYRGDFRLSGDNEGAIVNLQVEYFIRASGGDIITTIDAVPDALRSIIARQDLQPR